MVTLNYDTLRDRVPRPKHLRWKRHYVWWTEKSFSRTCRGKSTLVLCECHPGQVGRKKGDWPMQPLRSCFAWSSAKKSRWRLRSKVVWKKKLKRDTRKIYQGVELRDFWYAKKYLLYETLSNRNKIDFAPQFSLQYEFIERKPRISVSASLVRSGGKSFGARSEPEKRGRLAIDQNCLLRDKSGFLPPAGHLLIVFLRR